MRRHPEVLAAFTAASLEGWKQVGCPLRILRGAQERAPQDDDDMSGGHRARSPGAFPDPDDFRDRKPDLLTNFGHTERSDYPEPIAS